MDFLAEIERLQEARIIDTTRAVYASRAECAIAHNLVLRTKVLNKLLPPKGGKQNGKSK